MNVPEIRRSELNAVRWFLTSFRDEEREARSACALATAVVPLRARVAQVRRAERTAAGTGVRPCATVAV